MRNCIMRNWLKIGFVFVLIFSIYNSGYAQKASLKLPDFVANPGNTISVPVKVSTDSLIGIARFVIEYNKYVLEFINGTTCSATQSFTSLFNPSLPFSPTSQGTNKNVFVQLSSDTKTFSGKELEVVIFNFKVIGYPGETSPIRFDRNPNRTALSTSPLLNNISGSEIQFDDGSILITSDPIPDITVSPGFHDFGYISLPSTSTKLFLIKNNGNADLEISSISLDGADGLEFSLETGVTPIILQPNITIEILANFKPVSPGSKNASIKIISNDPDENPLEILLHGYSVNYAIPDIAVDRFAHDFGNVALGSTSETVVMIENAGNDVLEVSNIILSGSDAAQFSLGDQLISFRLNPTQSQKLTVFFKPASTGLKYATLSIMNNDPDEACSEINLTGNGTSIGKPDIGVDTLSYNFGDVALETSASKSFFVYNNGTADLQINSIKLIGANADQFSIQTDEANFTLYIGELLRIDVQFQPRSLGLKYASVIISSDDPDESSLEISLQGRGKELGDPDIYFEPLSYNFGYMLVGSNSQKTFLMKNTGIATLEITSISFTGPDSKEFSIKSGEAPFTLAPGKEANVVLQFHPTSLGQKKDTLRIMNNDPDENPLNIPITGNGVKTTSPRIFVDTSAYYFGQVPLGSSVNKIFIITSLGAANLSVTSTRLIGTNKDEFSIEYGGAPFQLAPQENRELSVSFHPATSGERGALLRIVSNDPTTNQFDISLLGTGIATLDDTTGTYAFPNPFKPGSESIQIFFNVKPFHSGTIKILDSHGDLVQKIEIPAMSSSNHQYIMSWDGRNTLGDYVANGVYFYFVETNDNKRLMNKIAVLR